MADKKGYPYIDYFRILAALLVITIHISPLAKVNPSLDFFLTRGVGRIAVPFFFMISGFFLFRSPMYSKKIKTTILSLLQIYGISILLYLPLQIYRGDFTSITISSFLQDILLDGTMYHLWYLPAVIIGLLISYVCVRYLSMKQALWICGLLYIIGLGGDSYYQVIKEIPYIHTLYQWLFSWMEYTRNGLFMAPIFIYLGYVLTQYHLPKRSSILFVSSNFILLLVEALLVHQKDFYRHDSMYVFLPLVTFFLCQWLLSYRGERHLMMKDISLYVYILHPLLIFILYSSSKVLHLEKYLFNQQWMQFLIVSIASFLVSYGVYKLKEGRMKHGKNKRLD